MWWKEQREKGIALTKMRIKHHEKHGNGDVVMKEKNQLLKQEKHHKAQKDKGR